MEKAPEDRRRRFTLIRFEDGVAIEASFDEPSPLGPDLAVVKYLLRLPADKNSELARGVRLSREDAAVFIAAGVSVSMMPPTEPAPESAEDRAERRWGTGESPPDDSDDD